MVLDDADPRPSLQMTVTLLTDHFASIWAGYGHYSLLNNRYNHLLFKNIAVSFEKPSSPSGSTVTSAQNTEY